MRNEKKIKLLQIVPALGIGGAEEIIVELSKHIDKNKFEMLVCCLQDTATLKEEIMANGVEVVILNQKNNYDFKVIFKLVKLLEKERADIIHTWMFGADMWGRLAGYLTRCPIMVSSIVAKYEVYQWKNHLVDRLLEPFTNKFIFVNKSAIDFARTKSGVKRHKIIEIPNPVDLEKFVMTKDGITEYDKLEFKKKFGFKETLPIIGAVARLTPQKGVAYFIKAIKILERDVDAQYLIVGDGPLRKELENCATALGIKSQVVFAGFQRNLPLIYSNLDVLVIPSLWEGTPLVMLNAMAAEVPVIGSDIDGISDLLKNNETGFTCKPEDSFSIAESIKRALFEKDLVKNITSQAKKVVSETCESRKVIKEYEAVYANLIKTYQQSKQ